MHTELHTHAVIVMTSLMEPSWPLPIGSAHGKSIHSSLAHSPVHYSLNTYYALGTVLESWDILVDQRDTTHSPPRVDVLVIIGGSPYEGLVSFGQRQEEAGEGLMASASASAYPRTTRRCPPARTPSPVDRSGVCVVVGTSMMWL